MSNTELRPGSWKTIDMVAFAGNVELEKAVWDTDWGMYVVLQIEQKPQEKDHANPFKRFTKMRKGRVGTRFDAVFTDGDDIVYEDEVMLKGWSDSTTGWKVTLWVHGTDGSTETHPFMHYDKGKAFSLVTVELDDDNEAINQKKRERLTRAEARKKYPLAMLAGTLCNSLEFQQYVAKNHRKHGVTEYDAEYCADFIRKSCGIESRKELDESVVAADMFHNSIRKPYLVWHGENYGH